MGILAILFSCNARPTPKFELNFATPCVVLLSTSIDKQFCLQIII